MATRPTDGHPNTDRDHGDSCTRRALLARSSLGLGALALAQLDLPAAAPPRPTVGDATGAPHFAPRAQRVIYLFQSGGPSQLETFDYKPELVRRNGEDLPDSIRRGQRLTGMSGNQARLPLAGPQFAFHRHGSNGTWVSELLPHTARIIDKLCVVRSMHTHAINHDPAIT
ncbi:MAG: DUF1501 domain-containing protein, partial [Planctomycetes bacterium]|nr:DUF1501 domain-containing protein [Planctomycetota bacterium]